MRTFALALNVLAIVAGCENGSDDDSEDGAGDVGDNCPPHLKCKGLDARSMELEADCEAATDPGACNAVYPSGGEKLACRSEDGEFVGRCNCGWIRELTVQDPAGACEAVEDDGGKCVPWVLWPYNDMCLVGDRVGACKSAWARTVPATDVSALDRIPVVVSDTMCSRPDFDGPIADCSDEQNEANCACAQSFIAETCAAP